MIIIDLKLNEFTNTYTAISDKGTEYSFEFHKDTPLGHVEKCLNILEVKIDELEK
ncbi:hypothetical protein [Staphylococcus casei]|uniref:Phage protein n=1 Tax=Staphylococcus casei TaxID=201828 RepID=A0ABZ2WCP9_9STAP